MGPFKHSDEFLTNWLRGNPIGPADYNPTIELNTSEPPPDALSLGGNCFIAVSKRLSKRLDQFALGGNKYLPLVLRQAEAVGAGSFDFLLIANAPRSVRVIVEKSKFKAVAPDLDGGRLQGLVGISAVMRQPKSDDPEFWMEEKQTIGGMTYASGLWPMVSNEAWVALANEFPSVFWEHLIPEDDPAHVH